MHLTRKKHRRPHLELVTEDYMPRKPKYAPKTMSQAEPEERFYPNETTIYYPPGLFDRCRALFADGVVSVLIWYGVTYGMTLVSIPSSFSWVHAHGMISLNSLAVILYFFLFYRFGNGQTLGKRMIRIKVTSARGGKLNWWQSLFRVPLLFLVFGGIGEFVANYFYETGEIVTAVLFVAGLVLTGIVRNKRGLHDYLLETYVEYR